MLAPSLLAPSFTNRLRSACTRFPARGLLRAVAQLSVIAACASRQSAPRAASPPLALPDSVAQPLPVAPIIRADSAQWFVHASVLTVERAPGVTRDSTTYEETLHSLVVVLSDSSAELTIWADSGMRVAMMDSVQSTPRQAPASIPPARLRYQLGPRTVTHLTQDPTNECSATASLLSPLLGRLLAYTLIPSAISIADTLQFATCRADARITTRYVLQNDQPSTNSTALRQISITGHLAADSTRFLPMHLRGDVSGSAHFVQSHDSSSHPLQLTLTSNLQFTSPVRAQQLQQTTTLILHRSSTRLR